MDVILRIVAYLIVGLILMALNGLYFRRIYYEFHPSEPSPVVAPFRIVGVKDDPDRGKVLAQMLIARVDHLNDELSESMDVLNQLAAKPRSETTTSQVRPADIRFDSPRRPLDDVPFGQYEPVDVNLSFGGVELGGLVSWAQRIAMSDRMVNISVQYDSSKTTLTLTPNRAIGESLWLQMDGADDRAMITELAYAFVKRGWESNDEELKKLTLAEFKALTKMINDAASVKLAGERATTDAYAALDSQIDQLLTPLSRAWESQRILKMCAVIADTAGNDLRAMSLYGRIKPQDKQEGEWLQETMKRFAPLPTDPRTTPVLAAAATTAQPIAPRAATSPATEQPATSTVASVAPQPANPPAAYYMRGTEKLLAQLHVPDTPMHGEPTVAIIGANPHPRVGSFASLSQEPSSATDQMTEYSTHLVELLRVVAPKSKVLFTNTSSLDEAEVSRTLQNLQNRNINIVLLTFGPLSPQLEERFAAMADRGTLVVSAAGNQGRGVPPLFNSASDRVLVAAAVDNRGQPAMFTQFTDKSVWAPGTGLLISSLGGQFAERSGTSYAAALAAGVAARVLAEKPNLSPKDLIQLLRSTSKPVVSGGPKMLNVADAIQ